MKGCAARTHMYLHPSSSTLLLHCLLGFCSSPPPLHTPNSFSRGLAAKAELHRDIVTVIRQQSAAAASAAAGGTAVPPGRSGASVFSYSLEARMAMDAAMVRMCVHNTY